MKITFRKANRSDFDSILQIYNDSHTEEENGRTATGWQRNVYPSAETIEKALERDDLFVEEADGKVVGTAIINQIQVDVYENAPWQFIVPDDKIMVLHTLAISPSAKGHGLGKAFVDFYRDYAARNNCTNLRMDTNETNKIARSFYKKLGFKEIAVRECEFNGIKNIRLVLLEKKV